MSDRDNKYLDQFQLPASAREALCRNVGDDLMGAIVAGPKSLSVRQPAQARGRLTLMSRGPGRVQRAIEAVFQAEPDNAFLLSELCERVYRGLNRVEKKHRIAVARAVKGIETLDCLHRDTLGREQVIYDPCNVMSYAMARLKSDSFGPGAAYRNNDPRQHHDPLRWRWNAMHEGYRAGTITEEEMETYETTFEIPVRLKTQLDAVVENKTTEQELREMLAPGGNQHKYIVEGGAWFEHTEFAKARRAAKGDPKKLAKIDAREEAWTERRLGKLMKGWKKRGVQ
jgi:hypothetical protein